ncbi:hypothetical protein ACFO5R_01280 [Halosolutus amylolyticus]|uniref:Polyketide cyclase n=1 Tax=Halosolutus amylolyticus TaxID=2932267 RepID=A0ABD5PJ06_9EURY|nr:hypothetical protein [Halosolutus amylolyticus]
MTSSYTTDVTDDLADSLVTASRTSLGDTLRSVVYFTPSEFDVLYVRQDLYDSPTDSRGVKSQLVDFELVGFAEAPVRSSLSIADGDRGIGQYEFTVRFHEDGFVVRKLVGNVGVLLTADSMDVTAFEEAAHAIERLLSDR